MNLRAPSPTARLALAAVAWLLALAPLATVAHDLEAQHEVCAEHGELVHAADHHGEGGDDHEQDGPAEHEHCHVFDAIGPSVVQASPPPAPASLPCVGAALPGAAREATHASVAVWLYAPKTSPPLA